MHLTQTTQFKTGKKIELILDEYFSSRGYAIEPTTPHEERVLCIGDRWFISPQGDMFSVEYKSGIQTFYTNNVFLEVISNDVTNKPGWVYTCQADYILYAALLNGKILMIRPNRLRREIEQLKIKFPVVKTSKEQNETYNTHGVIVPLEYVEKHLVKTIISI